MQNALTQWRDGLISNSEMITQALENIVILHAVITEVRDGMLREETAKAEARWAKAIKPATTE